MPKWASRQYIENCKIMTMNADGIERCLEIHTTSAKSLLKTVILYYSLSYYSLSYYSLRMKPPACTNA